MKELTVREAKWFAGDRGQDFESVAAGAATAAYEACRALRRTLRGDELDRWEALGLERQQRWIARAEAVGLGRIREVRGLYGQVLGLDGEALDLAWDGLLDWRLLELAVEFATLRLVMGSVLPEAVGPVLADVRRGPCV